MSYFPFFIDIQDKDGLIVGGGRIASHKIEKLRPFGAKLTVIAPALREELKEDKTITCLEREFRDSDVRGMTFVIAASDDRELNARIGRICQEQGILVNVVDDKENCGFLFPALVKEGKLTVGISTSGASPQVAASLRSRTAREIPNRMEAILDYLDEIRPLAVGKISNREQRAAFLKETAELCMAENRPLTKEETLARIEGYNAEPVDSGDLSPDLDGQTADDLAESVDSKAVNLNAMFMSDNVSSKPRSGRVILVGAGCGPWDLITLRGLNAVRNAQVLVYDDLLDTKLLEHVSESCEKIYVGKRSGRHSMPQEEINTLLVEKARQGKRIVRLKGGDPFVFGRGGEEMLAMKAAGIPVEEIPGITSAIAVPAAAGIPVTYRGVSRSFHVVTAHSAAEGQALTSHMEVLAGLEGTCVFLMGGSRLEEIAEGLMANGKRPDTPAAVIHGEFDGAVQVVRGTLADISERARQAAIPMPVVIVVGEIVGLCQCG